MSYDETNGESDDSRDEEGQEGPFCAAGFFISGEQRRRTRPMEQAKQHRVDGSQPGPTVVE